MAKNDHGTDSCRALSDRKVIIIDLILFTDIVRNTATVKHDGILVHSLVPAGCNIGTSFAIRSFVDRCIARDVYSGIHCIVVFSGVAVNIYNDNLFSVKEIPYSLK